MVSQILIEVIGDENRQTKKYISFLVQRYTFYLNLTIISVFSVLFVVESVYKQEILYVFVTFVVLFFWD
jgi:hypothetical protein